MKNKLIIVCVCGSFLFGAILGYFLKKDNLMDQSRTTFCSRIAVMYLEKVKKEEGSNMSDIRWEQYVNLETELFNNCIKTLPTESYS